MSEKDWKNYLIKGRVERMVEWTDVVPIWDEGEVEQEVKFQLEVEGVKYNLHGYTDLVLEENGKKVIVDYKTTYASGYLNIDDFKFQMYGYVYAVGIENVSKVIIPVLFSADKDDPIYMAMFKPTEEEMNYYIEEYKEAIRGIKHRVFFPKIGDDGWCKRVCQYKEHCYPSDLDI